MLAKYIILFVLLTAVLVVFSYFLFDLIDRHYGFPLILVLGVVIVADVAAMAGILFRFTRPSHKNNSKIL
jgi:hypothetical protein